MCVRSSGSNIAEVTVSELVVRVVLGQPLQVVSEQQLVAWNPLDRLQHVVLQGQAAAHVLALEELKGAVTQAARAS